MRRTRLVLLFMYALLLLICAAGTASAQNETRPGTSVERRGSSTSDASRRGPQSASTRVEGRASQGPAVPLNAVRVNIRYKKAMGHIGTSPFSTNSPYTCGAFSVKATTLQGPAGSFGRDQPVGSSIVREAVMREDGDFYVCDFTVTDLPLDKNITIHAQIGPEPQYVTGRWQGGIDPQPPSGYERALNYNGMRSVTLTNRVPRATVDFVLGYRPVYTPSQPR